MSFETAKKHSEEWHEQFRIRRRTAQDVQLAKYKAESVKPFPPPWLPKDTIDEYSKIYF